MEPPEWGGTGPGGELTGRRPGGTLYAMTVPSRVIVTWMKLSLLAAAVSACASSGNPLTQPTEYDTLMPGWESKFSIEWTAEPEPGGTIRLQGRIASRYGPYASPFRVLGMSVDASGKVIGQRIAWVPGGVPGFGHVYFEIGSLPAAPTYRVTVWDYTIIESRRTQAP